MATLAFEHIPYSDLISLTRMHMHYAANSTTGNANFVHQVAYMYMCESAGESAQGFEPTTLGTITFRPQKHNGTFVGR